MALLYGASYHYAYVRVLNPLYEYAHVLYVPPSPISLAFTYLLIGLPVLGYRFVCAPAAYGAALTFVVAYVPAQLFLLFNLDQPPAELALVQASIAASMTALLWTSTLGAGGELAIRMAYQTEAARLSAPVSAIMAVLTAVSAIMLLYFYRNSMQIVGLDDIYDLRFAASQTQAGTVANYTISWLGTLSLPFFYSRALLRKSCGTWPLQWLSAFYSLLRLGRSRRF